MYYIRIYKAIQYNSENNSWSTWFSKLKTPIPNVSESAIKLFDKYNEKNLSKTIQKSFDYNTFDNFIKRNNLAGDSVVDFLKDTRYAKKDLATYEQYLTDTGQTTSRFSQLTKSAGNVLKSFGASIVNMGIGMAAGMAIDGIITAVDSSVNAVTYAEEKMASAKSSMDSIIEKFNNQKSVATNKDLIREYERLSAGVDKDGKNIGLSIPEFQRFNEISNQIASVFPTLIRGYTNTGDAILTCKGNIEKLNSALQESARIQTSDYLEQLDTYIENSNTKAVNDTWFHNWTSYGESGVLEKKALLEKRLKYANGREFLDDIPGNFIGVPFMEGISKTGSYVFGVTGEIETYEVADMSTEEIHTRLEQYNAQLGSMNNELRATYKQYKDLETTSKGIEDFSINNAGDLLIENLDLFGQGFVDSDGEQLSQNDKLAKLNSLYKNIDKDTAKTINEFSELKNKFQSGEISDKEYTAGLANGRKAIQSLSGIDDDLRGALTGSLIATYYDISKDGVGYKDIWDAAKVAGTKLGKEAFGEKFSEGSIDGILSSLNLNQLSAIANMDVQFFDTSQIKNTNAFVAALKDYSKAIKGIGDIEATPNFDAFNAALESANEGNNYDSVVSSIETIQKLYESGLVGTDDFLDFARFISPDGLGTVQEYEKSIGKIKRYFTEDSTGVTNFMKDLDAKGLGEFNEQTGELSTNFDNVSESARKMGMSTESFIMMFQKLREYGYDTNIYGNADEALDDLKSKYIDLYDLQDQLAKAQAIDPDSSAVKELKSEIDSLNNSIDKTTKAYFNLLSGGSGTEAGVEGTLSELDRNKKAANDTLYDLLTEYNGLVDSGKIKDYSPSSIAAVRKSMSDLATEAAGKIDITAEGKIKFIPDMQSVDESLSDANEKAKKTQKSSNKSNKKSNKDSKEENKNESKKNNQADKKSDNKSDDGSKGSSPKTKQTAEKSDNKTKNKSQKTSENNSTKVKVEVDEKSAEKSATETTNKVQKTIDDNPVKLMVGNVDLANHPVRDVERFWFGDKDGTYQFVHVMPITPDGTVLDGEKDIIPYIQNIIKSGQDILDGDSKGIVMKVTAEVPPKEDIEKRIKTGEMTPAMESFLEQERQLDTFYHNVQDKIYNGGMDISKAISSSITPDMLFGNFTLEGFFKNLIPNSDSQDITIPINVQPELQTDGSENGSFDALDALFGFVPKALEVPVKLNSSNVDTSSLNADPVKVPVEPETNVFNLDSIFQTLTNPIKIPVQAGEVINAPTAPITIPVDYKGEPPTSVPDINGTVNYKGVFPTSAPSLTGNITYHVSYTGLLGGLLGKGSLTGNAFSRGNTYFGGVARASGTIGEPRDTTALINEVGDEMIVRGNQWILPHNPQFFPLKKGDIVFNAKQTEELLKYGHTNSRGKALAGGNITTTSNKNNIRLPGTNNAPKSDNSSSKSTDKASKSLEKAAKSTEKAAKTSEKTNDKIYNKWSAALETFKSILDNFNNELDKWQTKWEDALERGNTEAMKVIEARMMKSEAIYAKNYMDSYNEIRNDQKENLDALLERRPDLQGKSVLEIITDKTLRQNIEKEYDDKLVGLEGDSAKSVQKEYDTFLSFLDSLEEGFMEMSSMEEKFITVWDENKLKQVREAIESFNNGNTADLIRIAQEKGYANPEDFIKAWDNQDDALMGWYQAKRVRNDNEIKRRTGEYDKQIENIDYTLDILSTDDGTIAEQNALLEDQKHLLQEKINYLKSEGYTDESAEIQEINKQLRERNEKISENTKLIYENEQAVRDARIEENDFIIDTLGDNNNEFKYAYIMKNIDEYGESVQKVTARQKLLDAELKAGTITQNEYDEQMKGLTSSLQDYLSGMMKYLELIKQNKLDEIQKKIDDIQESSDEITDALKDQIEELEDEKEKVEELQDSWNKVVSAIKKTLKDQERALNDNRDSTTDYWNDMIDALQKANKETDRNVTLTEKLKNVEKAREQQTSLILRNGKFVYDSNMSDVRDAEYDLAETRREFSQEKAIEILEEQRDLELKNIDDRIKAIQKYQEKWEEVFDWYDDKVNEEEANAKLGLMWKDNVAKQDVATLQYVGSQYEANQSKIEGYYDKQIKSYQDMVDEQEKQTKKQIKALEKEQKAIKDTGKSLDDLRVKCVEMFKDGNTTGITALIKNFAEECNKAFGSIDTNILVSKMQEALSGTSSVSSGSNSSSNSSSSLSSADKEEFIKEYIELLENWDTEKVNALKQKYGFNAMPDIGSADYDAIQFSDGTQMAFKNDGNGWSYAGNSVKSSSNNKNNDVQTSTSKPDSSSKADSSSKKDNTQHVSVDKPINKENTLAQAREYLATLNVIDSSDTPYATKQEAYEKYAKGKLAKNYSPIGVIYGSGIAGYTAGIFRWGDGDNISKSKVFQAYAKGTDDAKRGYAVINEDGSHNGELVNFRGHEQVIDANRTIALLEGLDRATDTNNPIYKALVKGINVQSMDFVSPMMRNMTNYLSNVSIPNNNSGDFIIEKIEMHGVNDLNGFVNTIKRNIKPIGQACKRQTR